MTQREKAELLLRLQQPGSSLLLPNAWDAVLPLSMVGNSVFSPNRLTIPINPAYPSF